jgi:hypothetical protein
MSSATNSATPTLPTTPSSTASDRTLFLLSTLRRWLIVASHRLSIFGEVLARFFGYAESEDHGWSETCGECGNACALVTNLETSDACTGPLRIAQCAECVDVVVLDGNHSIYHYTANKRRVPASLWRQSARTERAVPMSG